VRPIDIDRSLPDQLSSGLSRITTSVSCHTTCMNAGKEVKLASSIPSLRPLARF